jgi:hypothetical protein
MRTAADNDRALYTGDLVIGFPCALHHMPDPSSSIENVKSRRARSFGVTEKRTGRPSADRPEKPYFGVARSRKTR